MMWKVFVMLLLIKHTLFSLPQESWYQLTLLQPSWPIHKMFLLLSFFSLVLWQSCSVPSLLNTPWKNIVQSRCFGSLLLYLPWSSRSAQVISQVSQCTPKKLLNVLFLLLLTLTNISTLISSHCQAKLFENVRIIVYCIGSYFGKVEATEKKEEWNIFLFFDEFKFHHKLFSLKIIHSWLGSIARDYCCTNW